MSPSLKRVLTEMALIFLAAATIGIVWNQRLLLDAWTGNAPAAPRSDEAQTQGKIPLPLGLMQARELYDRKEATFVDARDGKAFAERHITGARSLPAGEGAARLSRFRAEVPAAATLVVYCNGYDCHDSREVGKMLMENGYGTVYVFEGGFPEWRDAGYPTAGGKR